MWNIGITRNAALTSAALSSLTLVDGSATGGGVLLAASATPFLFTGLANAADDSISVNAVFVSGSASATVAVGSGSASAPVVLSSGVNAPMPLSSGMNTFVVSHVDGGVTTTYTLEVVRSWPISGYEIINAADRSVLLSKTGAAFNPAIQSGDTLVVGHAVDRVQVRMFYDQPTEASALPAVASVWLNGTSSVVGFPASGEWTDPIPLSVGGQNLGLWASIADWTRFNHTVWNIGITRASAFSSITSLSLPGVPAAGTPVPAGSPISVTPSEVTGSPTPTVTYDWEVAADMTFASVTVVATTTTPSWTPDNSVVDKFVRVKATADNGISTPTTVRSNAFGPISAANAAPTLASASISGTAQVGSPLTASVTGLTGYPAPTVTYAWEASVDGTTFSTVGYGAGYTPGAGDEGSVLRVSATADNSIGTPATASSSVTSAVVGAPAGGTPGSPAYPGTPPGTPFDVAAIAGDEAASVSWLASTSAGSFPVTDYEVASVPIGGSCLVKAPALACTVSGLTNGTAYTFTARALNGAGWGAWSGPSNAVTPSSPAVKTIQISGTRDGSTIRVDGTTIDLTGTLTPWVRFPGQTSYSEGSARPAITDNAFTWSRKANKKAYVYFTHGDVKSNTLTIPAR